MSIAVTPHLNFRGDARAALEHYRAAFAGEVVAITYAQMGAPHDPAQADEIVWGQVTAPSGFRVMVYDVQSDRPFSRGDNPFYVSVRATDPQELEAAWPRLVEGGQVLVPLGPAQWSARYGMAVDRFGITWVLDVEPTA
ncbi:VOC family protein [Amnibacterium setariae]|uniref:VOC family protein n=1 Tax=Amnibacterium setariae TaxID=2306585 RepID=A0A3A1TTA6_9MICO|nr:VOC family protein [Amnibacterium setariae]RIX26512.1 VOC family protein [Amnibacterium setariae]